MKLTNLTIIEINNALHRISVKDSLGGYAFARNLKRITPLVTEYMDITKLINKELADKDAEGNTITDKLTGKVTYGKNKEAAEKRHEDLNKEEMEFEPFELKLSIIKDEHLPGTLMVPLLDIIIIDDVNEIKA